MIGHNSRWAYYNEHDRFAAAWLRELIADGLIAPGEVDDRSIEDVTPDDLRSFRQCHFFAGIGVWSLAARLVGWDDDAPLWTGSCPCQPFSAAGKGGKFADERHLWPAFHYLIEQCGPPVVAGEQVAGTDGDAWLDLVQADMDATGYAFGAAETCAAGFGAPHERSRNYWVAHSVGGDAEQLEGAGAGPGGSARRRSHGGPTGRGPARRLGDAIGAGSQGYGGNEPRGGTEPAVRSAPGRPVAAASLPDRVADPQRDGRRPGRQGDHAGDVGDLSNAGRADSGLVDAAGERLGETRHPFPAFGRFADMLTGPGAGGAVRLARPGPVNGLWRDADWLLCRDEKWRPVEPGSFALVDAGTFRNRVGLLRGAGNAVNVAQAAGFLLAVRRSLGL